MTNKDAKELVAKLRVWPAEELVKITQQMPDGRLMSAQVSCGELADFFADMMRREGEA